MIQEDGARLAHVCGGARGLTEREPGGSQTAIDMPRAPCRAGCSPRTWASIWLEWRTCCSCMSWWKLTLPYRLRGCGPSAPLRCASATQEKVKTLGGGWGGEELEKGGAGKENIKS